MWRPSSFKGLLYMETQLLKFTTECSKVTFLISLLSGRALSWARAKWNTNTVIINSYEAFTNHFKDVFGSTTGELSISDQLLRLRQGASSTNDYTVQFRTLVAASGSNEAALLSTYRHVLDPCIRAQMTIYDDSVGLEIFMLKANRISQHLATCIVSETTHQSVSPASCPPVQELLQVDSTRLSHEERTRQLAAGLCLCCAATDHHNGPTPSNPNVLCLSPGQLGLLGQLHFGRPPKLSSAASPLSCPGAPSQNHPRKAARTWACEI
uniref:DUF4939 domain-containing protein n=1 Tax=Cyprinus carpio carpio TaxID=630221 RepID=A0A9J7ZJC5_CYPCA